MAVVRFDKVGMRYGLGPEILHDIDFSLSGGSFHYLTGPSGAGKTSLLRLMFLAERPSRGSIHAFGEDVTGKGRKALQSLRRRIGVVFQEFRMVEHLSAAENVALPLRLRGLEEGRIREHVKEIMAWVGLQHHMAADPATLSGGQQQRVAIARAAVPNPDLLLADEPTGNVDDALGERLLYLFEQMHKNGSTVVVATHNRRLIEKYPHPVFRLRDGFLEKQTGKQAGKEI